MKQKTILINEFYVKLYSVQNLFEVLVQSMNYCGENNIVTNNNLELAGVIREKIYCLMEEIDDCITNTKHK